MISLNNVIGFTALCGAITGIITILLMGLLSWKLRKNKWRMIRDISNSAPKKFRNRSKLMMESGASWLVGSAAGYTWIIYLMMRFLWRIPKSEILSWRINIKNIFDLNYNLYLAFVLFFNISGMSLAIAFLFYFLEK